MARNEKGGKGGRRRHQNIVTKLAWKLLRAEQIWPADRYTEDDPDGSQFGAVTLYNKVAAAVRVHLEKMVPDQLGMVVWRGLAVEDERNRHGGTPLYNVHLTDWLAPLTYESGKRILIELAVTTMVAEMDRILRAQAARHAETVQAGTEVEQTEEPVEVV